ncbi:MAG: hypothetical protein WD250_01840 [Egibacteraceae bacterium]
MGEKQAGGVQLAATQNLGERADLGVPALARMAVRIWARVVVRDATLSVAPSSGASSMVRSSATQHTNFECR